jgi:uncharacterized membrane protein YfcA
VLLLPRLVLEGSTQPALSALLLVPLAGGIVCGEWVHHRLDERKFRVAVAALLLAAGLTLLVSSVRS